MKIKYEDVSQLIGLALAEDIGSGDITTRAVFDKDHESHARIISKESGIFCGGDVVSYVYRQIDPHVKVKINISDGAHIKRNDIAVELSGKTISLLEGERTAMNFLQRMCGIATFSMETANLLSGTKIKILDTRKTLPGFRLLDKYAVKSGGGENHRMGLYDMVLIKDNHIKAAGGITEAIRKIKLVYGNKFKIEVEASNISEIKEALQNNADIIMLDNMSIAVMAESVSIINKNALIEVSGNVDEKRIEQLRKLDIDFISMGALTHSVTAFDLSMKFY
jgi:nicotinate-nucleotide pyrophosphorylase (carboxylating)